MKEVFPHKKERIKTMKFIRTLCLILTMIISIGLLPSCGDGGDPLANNAWVELTPDEKGRVNAVLTVDNRTLGAHAGERLSVYELLPGEGLSAIDGKEPLAVEKLKARITFRFDLADGERSRLLSSFVAVFEDGSTLTPTPRYIDAPEALAADKSAFLWSTSPKGLWYADAESALSYGAMHTVAELRLSAVLTDGATIPDAFDKQLRAAADAGLQAAAALILDCSATAARAATLCEMLAERYNGTLTSLLILSGESTLADDAAMWFRYASMALRSRKAAARVYLGAPALGIDESKAFFSDFARSLQSGGKCEWNALLSPVATNSEGRIAPGDLPDMGKFLLTDLGSLGGAYLAVRLPDFASAEPERQAVLTAFAYRLALSAGAGIIYANSFYAEDGGLCSPSGEERLAGEVFRTIDTGLSAELTRLCTEEVGEAWEKIKTPSLVSRLQISGNSHVGSSGFTSDPLFDFTEGELFGFVGVGTPEPPVSKNSSAWNAPVLYTWLDPSLPHPAGIRKILPDASPLIGASSLSVHLLTQAPDASTGTATLTVEGVAADGTHRSYRSQVEYANGQWQVVTFQLSAFVTGLDPEKPCVLTLTADPETESDELFVLWVRGIDIRRPEAPMSTNAKLIGVTAGITGVTFVLLLAVYLRTKKKKRK